MFEDALADARLFTGCNVSIFHDDAPWFEWAMRWAPVEMVGG
jgi:hypothetical protein